MSDNSAVLIVINKELGDNIDSLVNKCKEYQERLLKTKGNVTRDIKSLVSDKKSDICKTLCKIHNDRMEINSLKTKIEQLKQKFAKFKKETEHFRNIFQNLIKCLNHKCNHMMYLACLQCVASISNKIKINFANKDDNAIISYKMLCELSSAMSLCECKHLMSYINQVIKYWNSVLEQYYSKDFENILKQMKWPFTMSNSTDISKLDHLKQHFQCIANNLLKIQLPQTNHIDFSETSSVSQITEHFSHISLPITMLVKVFRKRFFFHFSGKKPTNKPDKPEWYLSRVISWIRDYRIFIMDWLGPVYKDNNRNPIDSQHEFIMGLLQSVVIKLNSDLQYFQLEDVTFSHIVDETLAFEHELRKVYLYPYDYPTITEVLTQAQIFFKWINMERKYANLKIVEILQNENRWTILIKDKEYFITDCAQNFLILLDTMSDRYLILRQPRHKLQFLKLQNDLLEEFKQKIIYGFDEITSNECLLAIICTFQYISHILYNRGTNVHFLSLLNYKCELETVLRNKNNNPFELEIVETVFDDTINSYQMSIDHLLNDLCDNIMADIKKHSKLYKRDKWHTMKSLTDENQYSITDSGWIFYEAFSTHLNTLRQNLPLLVFNKCWPKLAFKLSTFIYNDVLLDNMFNKGGAQHLLCDVRYKLLPIYSKYTAKPNIYIERLMEACRVLCFESNFKPVTITQNEVSEILIHRIEHGNSID